MSWLWSILCKNERKFERILKFRDLWYTVIFANFGYLGCFYDNSRAAVLFLCVYAANGLWIFNQVVLDTATNNYDLQYTHYTFIGTPTRRTKVHRIPTKHDSANLCSWWRAQQSVLHRLWCMSMNQLPIRTMKTNRPAVDVRLFLLYNHIGETLTMIVSLFPHQVTLIVLGISENIELFYFDKPAADVLLCPFLTNSVCLSGDCF